MVGCGPIAPSLEGMRILADGARALGGPIGTTLELCILSAALPFEILGIQLDRIDWQNGTVPVPARGRPNFRHLALATTARQCIIAVAGSAKGRGQAVTAGRGEPLKETLFRLDRINRRLAAAAPDTLRVAWNFHGLRVAAAKALAGTGAEIEQIRLFLHGRTAERCDPDAHLEAVAVAEKWSGVLRGVGIRAT